MSSWAYPLEDGDQMDEQFHTLDGQYGLEEVEQFMRNQIVVEDAAVLLRDGPDAGIVGFVKLYKRAILKVRWMAWAGPAMNMERSTYSYGKRFSIEAFTPASKTTCRPKPSDETLPAGFRLITGAR